MTYDIKFDTESPEADLEAFQAIVDYLGPEEANRVFGILHDMIRSGEPKIADAIRLGMMFQGVQGYPVEAFIRRYM